MCVLPANFSSGYFKPGSCAQALCCAAEAFFFFYGLVKENNKLNVCQAVLEAWGCGWAVQHLPEDIGGGIKTTQIFKAFKNSSC